MMNTTRRRFFRSRLWQQRMSLGLPALRAQNKRSAAAHSDLGGTGFTGPERCDMPVGRGHKVTVFIAAKRSAVKCLRRGALVGDRNANWMR